MYTGVQIIKDFEHIDELYKKGQISLDKVASKDALHPNMLLVFKAGNVTALGIVKRGHVKLVQQDQKIRNIINRNKEQAMVMELLKDKEIDCITITGPAGSGKTLLALAYGVEMLESGKISKLVLCKNFTPVGREIGFIKGGVEDKVRPWLGNFYDNLEILGIDEYKLEQMSSFEYQKMHPGKIEMSPITYIQGRSISNAVIIVDEVQNLPKDVIQQILTRPAENTKIILLGDPKQVFEKSAQNGLNGLEAVINAGLDADFIAHISMKKSERSRLAEWYSKYL